MLRDADVVRPWRLRNEAQVVRRTDLCRILRFQGDSHAATTDVDGGVRVRCRAQTYFTATSPSALVQAMRLSHTLKNIQDLAIGTCGLACLTPAGRHGRESARPALAGSAAHDGS